MRSLLFALSCSLISVFTWPHQAFAAESTKAFSTLIGLGFDKQASIWLIERYITPGRAVQIFESGEPPASTRYFDEPGGEFMRDTDHSTYEKLFTSTAIQSDYLQYFVTTVQDVEINLWLPDKQADSRPAETAFRNLQNQWGRDRVPHSCYREFFDQLQALYEHEQSLKSAESIPPKLACWKQALTEKLTNQDVLVTEMPIAELLGHMRSGAKVAFVDVREPDEYQENHIPGAVNLTITDANAKSVQRFKSYDLVVAYCIKDFRGFEMARKLRDLGIKQSAILNPFGIKGWIGSNMPVYKVGSVSEEQAAQSLASCVADATQCPASPQRATK